MPGGRRARPSHRRGRRAAGGPPGPPPPLPRRGPARSRAEPPEREGTKAWPATWPERWAQRERLWDEFATQVGEFVEAQKFENWAPRSSRAWRGVGRDADWKTESDAQNYRGEAGAAGGGLLAELKEASAAIAEEEAAAALQPVEVAGGARTGEVGEVGEVGEPAEDDFATAFAARLQEVGTSDVVAEAEAEEEDADPLTGVELAEICHAKYGKFHDMAIKHVTINKSGMRRWVALNIYVGSLGQRSFPYSKEEYLEKLDAVAALLTAWNCCAYVRAFFEEPPIPRRGLPSYPRVDTAVSLRLNQCPLWDDELAEEYFTY